MKEQVFANTTIGREITGSEDRRQWVHSIGINLVDGDRSVPLHSPVIGVVEVTKRGNEAARNSARPVHMVHRELLEMCAAVWRSPVICSFEATVVGHAGPRAGMLHKVEISWASWDEAVDIVG